MSSDPNLDRSRYPDSYYAASRHKIDARDSLAGDHTADICIVGGGFSGLSTALHLAEKGHKVTLIEGSRIGWGASGRNGGQIVNGINASLPRIKKFFGQSAVDFVGPLLDEGRDTIFRLVDRYSIDCDLKSGNIFTGLTDKHMSELEEKASQWNSYDIGDLEVLNSESIREHVGSDQYSGGLIDHRGGHFHPLNLAIGEAAAFEEMGGKIFENSPVIRVETELENPVIHTRNGKITTKTLVICGNAYLGNVVPELTTRVMPVSTQMMASKPLDEKTAQEILPTDKCVEDVRYILDYYRLSADKRLIWGGGTIYGGKDPKDIEMMLRQNLKKIYPTLADIEIDYVWSGWFALSFTRMPQMGRLGKNTYFAHGYSGHGVTGSHLFGKILAEAINGDLSRFDVFADMRWLPFPGGRTFRVPYSALGAWYYGLRDRLGL